MNKLLLAAGLAGATLIPSLAFAQQSCQPQRDTSMAGIAGTAINALLGNPEIRADCSHVYGYYDTNGMWHANDVDRASAQGYYDREGRWVAGAPNGYYDDQRRWTPVNDDASASGYYDSRGRWVPASANGYYDVNGTWIAGAAPGYYDTSGRWNAGVTTGYYDQSGRWIEGQQRGHRDANGVWVADAANGYYDTNGRWRAGPANGYYDANGRWFPTATAAGTYGANTAYDHRNDRADWAGAPTNFRARTNWLGQRIRSGIRTGSLARSDGERALRTLAAIRQQERGMRHHRGRLSTSNQAMMQARLDTLNASLRWSNTDRRWN
jgi:hypothetical protein